MADRSVYMDTNIFTGIVGDIRGSAYECTFPENALQQAPQLETFSAGRKMHKILKELHKTNEVYREESSVTLPSAFLKMRDSMIAIDKALSESIVVDSSGGDKGGVRAV